MKSSGSTACATIRIRDRRPDLILRAKWNRPGSGACRLAAERCAEGAPQRMAGNQAQRDAGRIFDIVSPLHSRCWQDRVTGVQALRYGHAGDRNDAESDRDRDRGPGAAATQPSQQETEKK